MKFYIDDNGEKYYLNLYNTEVMPYGYKAMFSHKDELFELEQRIVNDCVLLSILPMQNGKNSLMFSVEFYDSFCFKPHSFCDVRYTDYGHKRERNSQQYNNCIHLSFVEDIGESHIAIGSDTETEYIRRTLGQPKNILNYRNISKKAGNIVIAFDWSQERVLSRIKDTIEGKKEYIMNQDERYRLVMDKAPVLKSSNTSLNNFISLVPVYHESLKVTSYPGAIRAKTEHYWVWGWDSMTSPYAYSYWGDTDYLDELLAFYSNTADEKKGIAHWFNRDMSHKETSMVAAQGFYINLLYQYHLNGGDISKHYDYAKKVFERLLSVEIPEFGLCKGMSLYPDFRELILENGNDLSSFNNSSAYCAVCSMMELARTMDDKETYNKASAFAQRLKDGFNKCFFDENTGYYVGSADSITGRKRPVYTGMSIKWDNEFCRDLIRGKESQCLKYYEEKFLNKAGIKPFAVDNITYDADANQAHCYFPVLGEFYTSIINIENRKDLIDQFVGWISTYTDLLMCPEGINCYVNTTEPFIDSWNSIPGAWQAFSMRAWYEAVIHSIVGIDFNQNGMNVYPYDGEEMTLINLHFAGKTFDIYMKGSGTQIEDVKVNGVSQSSIKTIGISVLEKKHNIVEIQRR